jgi:hypothetical protein
MSKILLRFIFSTYYLKLNYDLKQVMDFHTFLLLSSSFDLRERQILLLRMNLSPSFLVRELYPLESIEQEDKLLLSDSEGIESFANNDFLVFKV